MNVEKETLIKGTESVNNKTEQVNKSVWEKEIMLQKKHDGIDKIVGEYNAGIYRLAVVDNFIQQKKLELEFNVHGTTIEQMLRPDVRLLREALTGLKNRYVSLRHAQEEERMNLAEEADRLAEQAHEKREEVDMIDDQIRSLNQQYNSDKEAIGSRNESTDKEIRDYESDIQKFKLENESSLRESEKRVEKSQLELQSTHKQYEHDRDLQLQSVVQALEAMIQLGTKMNESLGDVRGAL